MAAATLCGIVRADLPPAFSDLSPEAAAEQVEGTDKLIVMKFTADWCMPCKAMDQTTWRDDKVVAWVKEHGLAIQVDVDKQPKVAQKYQISAMPTMVMLKGGNEIARKTGYMNAEEGLRWLGDAAAGKLEGGPKVDKDSRNMPARLQTARELSMSGKPEEATDEFVWLWENIAEVDPSMKGVRSSFMASDMKNLAARHAPAKVAFTKLRDATAEKLAGAPSAGMPELRSDWVVLNEVIGDDDATLAWFDGAKGDPKNAKALARSSLRLVTLLVERDRLADIPALFPDPIATVKKDFDFCTMLAQHEPRLPDGMDEATKTMMREQPWTTFRERMAVLYTGYLTAGRNESAAQIMAEARKLYDDPRLVTGVVRFAIQNGQARPEMKELLAEVEKNGADVRELHETLDAAVAEKK